MVELGSAPCRTAPWHKKYWIRLLYGPTDISSIMLDFIACSEHGWVVISRENNAGAECICTGAYILNSRGGAVNNHRWLLGVAFSRAKYGLSSNDVCEKGEFRRQYKHSLTAFVIRWRNCKQCRVKSVRDPSGPYKLVVRAVASSALTRGYLFPEHGCLLVLRPGLSP